MKAPVRGRPFIKMNGLRNHFVIVDAREIPFDPDTPEVVHICDQQVGVGADQLIVLERARTATGADAFMRIINMDGREAEACGNATRCVAWLLLEEQQGDAVTIETLAGALRCERIGKQLVRCEMGRVSMDWRRIPLSEECDTLHLDIGNGPLSDAAAASVGNPHAVFFVDDLDAIDVAKLAPPLQEHPLFPEQANIGIAQMLDGARMRLSVYERGAGLTMACGSGACAAVFIANARGLLDAPRASVELPGGKVDIEIRADDVALMSGPVDFNFEGFL
ncbi:MAG: diaminopimelate epimerase [Woeseiaceae bacterium]|nr:diaminopimelate epimerase [Woeseiaceae bacterium]